LYLWRDKANFLLISTSDRSVDLIEVDEVDPTSDWIIETWEPTFKDELNWLEAARH
jgi:hypothetical protein